MRSIAGLAEWIFPSRAASPLPHQLAYRPDIDGLRAFAVIAVVIYHAAPSRLPGGFAGVDVFFVISGMLITALILKAARQNTFSYAEFYGRRIRRIVPAFLLVLVSILAAGWFSLIPAAYVALNKAALSSVLFIPNLRFWWEAGYFEGLPTTRILLHLWSLGVEEQFYLIWPAAVLLFWRRRLPLAILILAGLSFAACLMLSASMPTTAFYWPITRFWELLAGALLAWWHEGVPAKARDVSPHSSFGRRNLLSLAGLLLLICAILLLDTTHPYPGWRAALPVAGTMLVIAGGPGSLVNKALLQNRISVWLGQISYPLYLWHWPMIALGWNRDTGPLGLKEAVAISLLLAAATYELLEKPIRRLRSGARRTLITRLLLLIMLLVGAFSAAVIAQGGVAQRFPAAIRPFVNYPYDDAGRWASHCFLNDRAPPDSWFADNCVPANLPGRPLLILWGDSRAAELAPAFAELQRQDAFRLGKMTGAGCPPVLVEIAENANCAALNRIYLAQIRILKPKWVVLAGYWSSYAKGFAPLEQTIRTLKIAGVERVVVIGPTPVWPIYLPDILVKHALAEGGQVPAVLPAPSTIDIHESAVKAMAERAGADYISAFDVLCPGGQCRVRLGAGPQSVAYFDDSHLTAAGSTYLVRAIQGKIFTSP